MSQPISITVGIAIIGGSSLQQATAEVRAVASRILNGEIEYKIASLEVADETVAPLGGVVTKVPAAWTATLAVESKQTTQ